MYISVHVIIFVWCMLYMCIYLNMNSDLSWLGEYWNCWPDKGRVYHHTGPVNSMYALRFEDDTDNNRRVLVPILISQGGSGPGGGGGAGELLAAPPPLR